MVVLGVGSTGTVCPGATVPVSGEPDRPWYLGLSVGWIDSPSLKDSRSDVDSISFGDGQQASLTVGKPLAARGIMRLELQARASKRNLDTITRDDGSTINGLGDWQSGHLMVNAYHDVRDGLPFGADPYLGIGAGVVHVDADYNGEGFPPRRTDSDDTVLAAQGLLGLRIPLTDDLGLDGGYRFRATGDLTLTTIDGTHYTSEGLRDHQVELGLVWNLRPAPPPSGARSGGAVPRDRYGEITLGGVYSPILSEGRSSVKDVEFHPGPKLAVRAGSPWRGANPFAFSRWDLGVAYRTLEVERLHLPGGTISPGRGQWKLTTLMANGYWDFREAGWRPYLGLGLGGGRLSVDYDAEATPPQRTDDEDFRLAYQVMAGWQKAIGHGVHLVVGYRVTGTTTPELTNDVGSYTTDYIQDHQVELGTRYHF